MKWSRARGSTSNIITVFLMDSTSTTGAGKTGLTNASAGLNVSVRRELSSAVTAFTGANIGAIVTLGTWVDPGAGKVNFKEVDSTNQPGVYEIHFQDTIFGSGDASRYLTGMVQATGVAPCPFEVELTAVNNQDGVHGGMSALPNTACTTNASLITSGTGTDQLQVTAGLASSNAKQINGVATTSVTTVNANLGTSQPTNFTGTGASALVKSDAVDIGGVASASGVIGSVGSVTGSVGSVTGNVGGSVGSVVAVVSANVTQWSGTAVAGTLPPDTEFIRSGTAQGGGASTITLDAGASATNNFYQNAIVQIYAGTGAGQCALITTYVGATKVATINGTWATNPDATSKFVLYPFGAISANVAGNVTVGGYAAGEDPATLVLGATASSWNTAGTIGNKINSAGSAGDPWATAIPGAYGAGTAGNIVGNNLNATVSSRLAASSYTTPPTTAQIATTVWQDLTAGSDFSTAGSIGLLLKTDIDAAISSRGTGTALTASQVENAVWDGLTANHSTAGSFGLLVKTDLDTNIGSRLATSGYTAPPTAASIATTIFTDLTAGSDFGTAGSFGALVKANLDTNVGSRMATFSLPANFAALGISVGGHISNVDTLTTYTGDTPQSGDSFARLGAPAGASVSADIAACSHPATAQTINLTTAIPVTGNTANTIADCLNAARGQAFGAWKIVGTTLTLYAPDGTTAIRTFTLDSATTPTQRT